MKYRLPAWVAMAATTTQLLAQVSVGGTPYSLRAALPWTNVPTVHGTPFNAAAVAEEDARREAEGLVPAYARVLPVNAGLYDAGQWATLPNGDRLWRLRVASTGALATELFYTDFHLPANATLHVFSEDGSTVLGGFTAFNNRTEGEFTTSLVPGEASLVEYYEPAAVAGEGNLHISGVGHAYRDVAEVTASGACEVDVNCSEGNDWHPQRDATVRISIQEGGFMFWCTGALVNNLAQDCKPYYLTAQHCYTGANQSELNQWKFYFNYERSGCGSGSSPSNHTMVGCFKRGASNDNGGDSGSDFLLVEGTTAAIPGSYNPYWAGWDASGTGGNNGVGIHHPAGDRKKISSYTTPLASSTWGGVSGTHWRVKWAATANGHGVTEQGSSGSPLFNAAKRIIGTLTGGTSSCSNVNGFDYYGKISYHWQSNPGPSSMRLKNFLDPAATGTLSMDGSYDPCGMYVGIAGTDAPVGHLQVWPNPATDAVVVSFPGQTREGLLEVHDMGGRMVAGHSVGLEPEFRLNTTGLQAGAYLLRWVVDGHTKATAPLIVVQP